MPSVYSLMLLVAGFYGLGVCTAVLFLLPWRTLAVRQSAWIMAKQDMAATMVSHASRVTGDQPTREQAERDRVSDLYYLTMARGEASEEEIEELRKAGCVSDGVIS